MKRLLAVFSPNETNWKRCLCLPRPTQCLPIGLHSPQVNNIGLIRARRAGELSYSMGRRQRHVVTHSSAHPS
ncbi:hypothetical protein E2C01_051965 [Portunus trituberculatus]|uniref:Uncharacterized protein n=1 Tax=Portunus trituberculatus TaxID=210409 RepID=A0A5B7GKG4_PORTR|nr:hypothetical protein [Portunus trituberculatus]